MYKNTKDINNEEVLFMMNEYNTKMNEIDKCNYRINSIKSSVDTMKGYGVEYDQEKVDEMIRMDSDCICELKSELNLIDDAIERIQRECEHDMVNCGHDSHYDYYRCRKCGFEDRW